MCTFNLISQTRLRLLAFAFVGLLCFGNTCRLMAEELTYDPLATTKIALPEPLDLLVKDQTRDREIPVYVYLPAKSEPAPVVLFSHGLGGWRQANGYLGKHWSAHGYVVVFLQHHGSDDAIWRKLRFSERMESMKRAASSENFLLRVHDVPAVLDQLEKWNNNANHPLSGRLDTKRVGMCGHSFGAVTTQAVSGQSFARGGLTYTDDRIKAALAFSPSSPRFGGTADHAFANVHIPWMLMTGTKDTSPIGGADVASRLAVFPALPAGDKFELVLDNAEHSAFNDRPLPGDREKRNPNHHRAILALGAAFWDTYLRDDPAAKKWLLGDGPRQVLEPGDRWQTK